MENKNAMDSWMPADSMVFKSAADIANMLAIMAELAQITDNQYREKAFLRAAKIFRSPQVPATIGISNINALVSVAGIGPGILSRVDEFVRTGTVAEIETTRQSRRYQAFVELTRIMGVGPKTASVWMNLGIYNLGDLRRAVGARKIVLTKQQELGLRWYADLSQRIPRSSVELIVRRIRGLIIDAFVTSSDRVVIAGSYRRGAQTSGDIDILVRGNYIMNRFTRLVATQPEFIDFVSSGSERVTFIWCGDGCIARQIDILLRPDSAWGAALAYFTGDAQFAQSMRARAKRLGYKLNQNGLYKKMGRKKTLHAVSLNSEEDLFKLLGLSYIQPVDRIGELKYI